MKKLACLSVLLIAAAAHAQTLSQGMTLSAFQQTYEAGVKFDQEAAAALSDCKAKPAAQGLQTYQCRIGAVGYLGGVVGRDSKLKDVSVTVLADKTPQVFLFQRAAKYAVNAANGSKAGPGLQKVVDLMAVAVKTPGKPQSATEVGVRYTALLDKSIENPGVPAWTFSIERL
ncbi:MAG: hypothetical protein HYX47_10330 [Burkholderiales bacterium]|nr:hypothetical protein [Burkholderiales bacterium]